MNQYAERVARGVLWLDHMHDGWRDEIDLGYLDIQEPRRCIIGQVFGGWTIGLSEISQWDDVTELFAADMGFNVYADENKEVHAAWLDDEVPYEDLERANGESYARLENEWRTVLSA